MMDIARFPVLSVLEGARQRKVIAGNAFLKGGNLLS